MHLVWCVYGMDRWWWVSWVMMIDETAFIHIYSILSMDII